jgi:signal transduction histidine kinase/ligand-binding sensor domain-containing protein
LPILTAQDNELNFFQLSRENGLSNNTIKSIVIDDDGFVWIGTDVGLNRYDGNNFHTFYKNNNKNSLPDNIIENLFKCSSGKLWVSTKNHGISLYNPTNESFKTFNLKVKETANEELINVTDIIEDSDSIIYLATNVGLYYKQKAENNFTELEIIPQNIEGKEFNVNSSIGSIAADENNGIWIIYKSWDIIYYHHKKNIIKHYSSKINKKVNKIPNITTSLHVNGNFLIGTNNYILYSFNPVKNELTELLKEARIIAYTQLVLGKEKEFLWMATSDGLMKYHLSTGELVRYTTIYGSSKSLSETSVSCVYEGDNDILWVGSYSTGINYAYLNLPFKQLYVIKGENYALSGDNVTDILHDSFGNIWFVYVGGEIERFDIKTSKKSEIPINSLSYDWGPGTVFRLFQDSKNNIYACSWSGGVQKYNPDQFRFIPLTGSSNSFLQTFEGTDYRDISEDPDGNLWLSAHGIGVFCYNSKENSVEKFDQENGLSNNWVFDIAIDTNGFVWVGSAWGLSKIDRKKKEIKTYYANESDTSSLSDNLIRNVTITDDGKIFIATENGLSLYNDKSDNFYNLKFSNNQIETKVRSIEQDNFGTYWLSTTNGIIKFNLKETQSNIPYLDNFHFFNTFDGLQSDYYNINSSSKDGNGYIFFGSRKGIDYFNPRTIIPRTTKPKIKIIRYEINGRIVFPGSESGPPINNNGYILLNHTQNNIDIEYVAIHFNNVERDEFFYKLYPIHENWNDLRNNRNILFSNLKPGSYELSLMVETDKGLTDIEENIVKFYIKPPFWQTTIFRVLLIIIIVSFILIMVRIYTAYLRRRKIQLEKIVRERTIELQENNKKLKEQSEYLNETNTLLEERQQQIEEQTEELRAQSEELIDKNEKLSKLVALKDKFFSIIAHDLKNPFNTILGFSELLKNSYDEQPDEKRKRLIDYIYNSGKSAYALLENLLTWSRSQTNKLEAKPNSYMVEHIIESNYRLIKGTLKQKKITFETNYDKSLYVWTDESIINTVIRNLLSNAAKFSNEGDKITFNAELINEDFIQFEIKDTGVGLTKEEINALFKIDSKLTKPGTSGEKGTGLGMILCKEFIEKLNGNIWIESEIGVGTSVFFTVRSAPIT